MSLMFTCRKLGFEVNFLTYLFRCAVEATLNYKNLMTLISVFRVSAMGIHSSAILRMELAL